MGEWWLRITQKSTVSSILANLGMTVVKHICFVHVVPERFFMFMFYQMVVPNEIIIKIRNLNKVILTAYVEE